MPSGLTWSRFVAWGLLMVLSLVDCVLYGIPLAQHTGGGYETGCLILHMCAMVLLTMQAFHYLSRQRAVGPPDNNVPDIAFTALVLLFSLVSSVVIFLRARLSPGLQGDYAAQSDPTLTVTSVLALTLTTTLMALAALILAIYDKYPGIRTPDYDRWQEVDLIDEPKWVGRTQVAPLGHNEKHHGQAPRYPEPTYTSWPSRYTRMAKNQRYTITFDSNRMVSSSY
ncbi:hypothetical protein OBBRIDRAFT_541797 [Obba rivulosa]|uniref:Uncharacterized protein n=1 Tax=Obba rivulosa TaxID=1052685 RepID=A0A8E2DU17_9APHY|nr:hypothetical protein OBBRIDRAFT_541797 [Obba rivulosa]